jgi:hypothetical protein
MIPLKIVTRKVSNYVIFLHKCFMRYKVPDPTLYRIHTSYTKCQKSQCKVPSYFGFSVCLGIQHFQTCRPQHLTRRLNTLKQVCIFSYSHYLPDIMLSRGSVNNLLYNDKLSFSSTEYQKNNYGSN